MMTAYSVSPCVAAFAVDGGAGMKWCSSCRSIKKFYCCCHRSTSTFGALCPADAGEAECRDQGGAEDNQGNHVWAAATTEGTGSCSNRSAASWYPAPSEDSERCCSSWRTAGFTWALQSSGRWLTLHEIVDGCHLLLHSVQCQLQVTMNYWYVFNIVLLCREGSVHFAWIALFLLKLQIRPLFKILSLIRVF